MLYISTYIRLMKYIHQLKDNPPLLQSETRLQSPRRSHLSDEEFLQWMISLGGTPPEILANPEALKLFLPVLRADLKVVENYRYVVSEFHRFIDYYFKCAYTVRVSWEQTISSVERNSSFCFYV